MVLVAAVSVHGVSLPHSPRGVVDVRVHYLRFDLLVVVDSASPLVAPTAPPAAAPLPCVIQVQAVPLGIRLLHHQLGPGLLGRQIVCRVLLSQRHEMLRAAGI